MIAGGTGITPMIPIIRSVLSDESDNTQLDLLFANKKEEDIISRDKLENRQEEFLSIQVYYTLDDLF